MTTRERQLEARVMALERQQREILRLLGVDSSGALEMERHAALEAAGRGDYRALQDYQRRVINLRRQAHAGA